MTRAEELHDLAARITAALELPTGAYFVEFAYGRPRLVRKGGSVDVSPRLPKSELELWMRAYLDGILETRKRGSLEGSAYVAGAREYRS